MAFNPVVANAGRLQILTALAVQERQEFVQLRRATQLTDGNLASHARRLQSAGLIAIDKEFRSGKPVTQFALTSEGRKALELHVRRLMAALSQRRLLPTHIEAEKPAPNRPQEVVISPSVELPADEDWVD